MNFVSRKVTLKHFANIGVKNCMFPSLRKNYAKYFLILALRDPLGMQAYIEPCYRTGTVLQNIFNTVPNEIFSEN